MSKAVVVLSDRQEHRFSRLRCLPPAGGRRRCDEVGSPAAFPSGLGGKCRRRLPASLSAYNLAVREICAAMEMETTAQFVSSLHELGVAFDSPKVALPLHDVEIVGPPLASNEMRAGIPLLLGYETKKAPLYSPEGLFVDATAIYGREIAYRSTP
jgi:hypothetical protein